MVRVLVGLGLASAVACAQGGRPDLGFAESTEPKETTEPSEPEESVTVPPSTDPEEPTKPGTDAGADASAADASGGDAGADSGVDSGVDSGACATVPPSNACGLAPQCGCAANQTCDVTNGATGAVSCVLAGGGTLGTYCTGTNQCAKGLTCRYNACRPHCATAGTACSGAGLGQCTPYYDPATGTPEPNTNVCTIQCDLRNPSAACGSNNCIWDVTSGAPDCDKSGTKKLYDACNRYNDCVQGLACAQHPLFGYECEKWCRIGQNDCGLLESCEDVYGASAPTSGGFKLGHCQ